MNESGIADQIETLKSKAISELESVSSAEALDDKGTITLTADDYDGALRALTEAGFKTVTDDSLLVSLPDEPGALAKVAEKLKQGGVNIQSLHIVDRRGDYTTVAILTEDRAKAESLLDEESIV